MCAGSRISDFPENWLNKQAQHQEQEMILQTQCIIDYIIPHPTVVMSSLEQVSLRRGFLSQVQEALCPDMLWVRLLEDWSARCVRHCVLIYCSAIGMGQCISFYSGYARMGLPCPSRDQMENCQCQLGGLWAMGDRGLRLRISFASETRLKMPLKCP